MRGVKVKIEGVDNGYVLKVLDHGEDLLKEPYRKDHTVHESFDNLLDRLRVVLKQCPPDKTFTDGKGAL